VIVTGTGLDAVKQVSFDGKPLVFWKPAEGNRSPNSGSLPPDHAPATNEKATQLEVLLNRDITSKEGHQTFLLQVDEKTVATALITIAPNPTPTIVLRPPASTSATKEKAP
jgi:hypothetical protein